MLLPSIFRKTSGLYIRLICITLCTLLGAIPFFATSPSRVSAKEQKVSDKTVSAKGDYEIKPLKGFSQYSSYQFPADILRTPNSLLAGILANNDSWYQSFNLLKQYFRSGIHESALFTQDTMLDERINVASSKNGAKARAQNFTDDGTHPGLYFHPSYAIDGNRHIEAPHGDKYWRDEHGLPTWLEVSFNGAKVIDEIDVFTIADYPAYTSDPTPSQTFTQYGIKDFQIQYWNDQNASWQAVPGGSVSGNNLVWIKVKFPAIHTTRIRVVISRTTDGVARIAEVAAYATPAQRINAAASANGGRVTAQNFTDDGTHPGLYFHPSYAIDGNRHIEAPHGDKYWRDEHGLPTWLEVSFNGAKVIDEIDVFTIADYPAYTSDPTPSQTFTQYGIKDFQIQYWNDQNASWQAVPGGSVSDNNLVWRKISLEQPITTSKIKVAISRTTDRVARIAEVEAWTTTSNNPSPRPSPSPAPEPTPKPTPMPSEPDFSMARLDPRNRVGTDSIDLFSGNYNWSIPIVNLKGRADLDLNVSLSYNSLVWTKDATGTQIKYDIDRGFPSPGFRLSLPVIEQKYLSRQTGKNTYLLIMPSGERVDLRQIGAGRTYEAADSSYLLLTEENGLVVRTVEGTRMQFFLLGGIYYCTEIKDKNGNIISIDYQQDGRIHKITDTVGRIISFNYDFNNRLSSLTQERKVGGSLITYKWAEFIYADQTVQTSFSGISVVGPQNGSHLPVLRAVKLAGGFSHEFLYNGYGQVYQIRNIAADSHELSRATYTMDISSNDCPRVKEKRDYAEHWNDGLEAVTAISQTSDANWTMPDDGVAYTGKVSQVTSPDKTITKVYYPSTGWGTGLPILTETITGSIIQRWARTKWTQDNEGVAYQQNPRPIETIIGDLVGNRKRTITTYQNFTLPDGTSCSLPVDVAEASATNLLRHVKIGYNLADVYTSRRIIGLPDTVQMFEGEATLLSKLSYAYDEAGYLTDQANIIQHDSSYTTGLLPVRGNLTSIRRWSAARPSDEAFALTSHIGYNTAGSVISVLDPLGRSTTIGYADSYSGRNSLANTFAYPTIRTDAGGFSTSLTYDYDTGDVTKARNPLAMEVVFQYDSSGRITRHTLRNGATNADISYMRFEYLTNGTEVLSYQLLDIINGVGIESISLQRFDGNGNVIGAARNNPSVQSGYSGQRFSYDVNGRVIAQSNPLEISDPRGVDVALWKPVGNDATAGWQWRRQTYDWLGRVISSTNVDNTRRLINYEGCGCAGGETRTITDETGRTLKEYSDLLGRSTIVELMNLDSTVYSTTVNVYNARDQRTFTRVYKGGATNDGSCQSSTCQETALSYDGYGRLMTVKGPGQSAPTFYEYNPDDTIRLIQDARGATTNFYYNTRQLVNKVVYGVPTDPSTGGPRTDIPQTSAIEFGYNAAGNRNWMTDGLGRVDYVYNVSGELESETRFFKDIGESPEPAGRSYTLRYAYNLAGQLKRITDPFNSISYTYDSAGQLDQVTGTPYGAVSTYASDFTYTAWGGLRAVTYGDGRRTTIGYNERLQLADFQVSGSSTQHNLLMKAEYQYYPDGKIRFARDLVNDKFDRAYDYDHVGRIKTAYTGAEARAFINGTTTTTADRPYFQSYGFDVWGNTVSRTTMQWSKPARDNGVVDTFINNKRQKPGWTYNENGSVTQGSTLRLTYDAAGRTVRSWDISRQARPGTTQLTVTINQSFDGDGRMLKRAENNVTKYYLISTAFGGKAVAELEQSGERVRGFVYALGGKLAVLEKFNEVEWLHYNPVTASLRVTTTAGFTKDAVEPDPLGVDAGLYDKSQEEADDNRAYNKVYPKFGAMNDFRAGCAIDGFMVTCDLVNSFLSSNTIVPCPDNDCGPRVFSSSLTIGDVTITEDILTSGFRAYSNGAAGFWINGVGSPDTYVPNQGGDTWRGSTGGVLVQPGFGYRNSGMHALTAGLMYYSRSFNGSNQNSSNSSPLPITYEEWNRIQWEIDKILKSRPVFQIRPKPFTEEEIKKLKELVRRRDGRKIVPNKPSQAYLNSVAKWNDCSVPLIDAYNQFLIDLNEDKFLEALGKSANAVIVQQPNGSAGEGFRGVLQAQADALFEQAVATRRAGITLHRTINQTCGPKP